MHADPDPVVEPSSATTNRPRLLRRVRWFIVGVGLVGLSVLAYRAARHEPGLTVTPPTDAPAGRWVVLEGANNTRDIGGYSVGDGRRVRWQRLYRSGELSGLTSTGGEAYRELGVRQVIDFRYRTLSSPLFDGDAFAVFSCSTVTLLAVHAVSDRNGPAYVQSVRENADAYRQAFELVADEANLPALVHCRAGKDRTGIFVALLLTLLGVEREAVLDEFMLSNEVDAPVDRATMAQLLDEVERTGGIEKYLANIGVTRATQTRLRELLLEKETGN